MANSSTFILNLKVENCSNPSLFSDILGILVTMENDGLFSSHGLGTEIFAILCLSDLFTSSICKIAVSMYSRRRWMQLEPS